MGSGHLQSLDMASDRIEKATVFVNQAKMIITEYQAKFGNEDNYQKAIDALEQLQRQLTATDLTLGQVYLDEERLYWN